MIVAVAEELGLKKTTMYLPVDAHGILKQLCKQRREFEAGHVPYGRVVAELLRKHGAPEIAGAARNGARKKRKRG